VNVTGLGRELRDADERGTTSLSDDERAIRTELDALLAAGTLPAGADDPSLLRTLTSEREICSGGAHAADLRCTRWRASCARRRAGWPDIAALDEALALHPQADHAARGVRTRPSCWARDTIARARNEAHKLFARRLEQYSVEVLSIIHRRNRYGQIFVDPATLAINVRIPENGQISRSTVSRWGRAIRFALVGALCDPRGCFAEGLGTPPLLLEIRSRSGTPHGIERCLPVLVRGAGRQPKGSSSPPAAIAEERPRRRATVIALRRKGYGAGLVTA